MGNAVLHFEIQAREPKKLNDFYRSLFEWTIDDSNPMGYGLVDTGSEEGIRGGIGPAAMGDGGPTFYVQVPDLEAALVRAEELGGKRVMGPMDVPGGPSIALFHDLEGNTIGLLK